MMKTRVLFLIAVCLFLSGSSVQKMTGIIPVRKPVGYYHPKPEPSLHDLTWQTWFQGTFQQKLTENLEDHVGFRGSLIRLHNECDYHLFGITHAEGFIEGKNRYFFEEDYILEYLGRYFIGADILDTKLQKLSETCRDLQKAGVHFVLVMEPGKASFYPEYIPDRYHPEIRTQSNYDYISSRVRELGIPMVDLNHYFLELKDTSRYTLFPRYGMHWSIYGSVLAMDSLLRYIETVSETDLPDLTHPGIEVSDVPRSTDADILGLLNLFTRLPREPLAYPVVNIDRTKSRKLSVLVIADSYQVNINPYFSGSFFQHQEYWYYNSKLYPHIFDSRNPVYIDKRDLQKKLREFDVILLMVSEINLHCGFWNFADEAYAAFHPGHRDPPWVPYQNSILNDREWFRFVVAKAKERQIPLGEAIIRDAKYMYNLKK
ncbi:MAG: hypothetical protein D4R67_07640 [Bacteroidetes bacterium]|nr:MAG: hypothetical protein D4R67_07640 [Bacteroidota bacterium]